MHETMRNVIVTNIKRYKWSHKSVGNFSRVVNIE